jgi:hypothetical protein
MNKLITGIALLGTAAGVSLASMGAASASVTPAASRTVI